ncbi:hypothetical protein M0804_005165 [Polistes exclamans]|nr:hypothetical protein M0804_005165 [Polistes exclamans]
MHGLSHLLSHHNSNNNNENARSNRQDSKNSSSSSNSSFDTRQQDTKILHELLNRGDNNISNKLYLQENAISRGSVSSTYRLSHRTSNHNSLLLDHHHPLHHNQPVYHTIHGSGQNHQTRLNHHYYYHQHHQQQHHLHHHQQHYQHHNHNQLHPPIHNYFHQQQQQTGSGRSSPASPSPTGEHDKHHHSHHNHHHGIQDMIRHFGRRLGHIRRQSECQETPRKREDEFRNRSQSLDGGARQATAANNHHREIDCETTYRIYESILRQGALRRSSLDPGPRRLSLGTPVIPHRASDACLDPVHAAILFRDARGLPVVDPFLEKVSLSDLGKHANKNSRVVAATATVAGSHLLSLSNVSH